MKKVRHGKLSADSEKLVEDLYIIGGTIRNIAQGTGISKATVYNILNRRGTPKRRIYVKRGSAKKNHKGEWSKFDCPWEFTERSTRNCIQARVRKGLVVECAEGHCLGKRSRTISLKSIITYGKLAHTCCVSCSDFKHDRR